MFVIIFIKEKIHVSNQTLKMVEGISWGLIHLNLCDHVLRE